MGTGHNAATPVNAGRANNSSSRARDVIFTCCPYVMQEVDFFVFRRTTWRARRRKFEILLTRVTSLASLSLAFRQTWTLRLNGPAARWVVAHNNALYCSPALPQQWDREREADRAEKNGHCAFVARHDSVESHRCVFLLLLFALGEIISWPRCRCLRHRSRDLWHCGQKLYTCDLHCEIYIYTAWRLDLNGMLFNANYWQAAALIIRRKSCQT